MSRFIWIGKDNTSLYPSTVVYFQEVFHVPLFLRVENPSPLDPKRPSLDCFFVPIKLFLLVVQKKKLEFNQDEEGEDDGGDHLYSRVTRERLMSNLKSKEQILQLRKSLGLEKAHVSLISLFKIIEVWIRRYVTNVYSYTLEYFQGFSEDQWFTIEEWWERLQKKSIIFRSFKSSSSMGLMIHYFSWYQKEKNSEKQQEKIETKEGQMYLHQWFDSLVERSIQMEE